MTMTLAKCKKKPLQSSRFLKTNQLNNSLRLMSDNALLLLIFSIHMLPLFMLFAVSLWPFRTITAEILKFKNAYLGVQLKNK